MKKSVLALAVMLVLTIAFSAFAADVTIMLNGSALDTRDANGNHVSPFIEEGTTYVPVRAIATALSVNIDWDGDTRTVFIGEKGQAAPVLGDNVNIYISGTQFKPTDAAGKAVYPIIKDGTTYLPVRAIAQAFAKKVDWDGETATVIINDSARIDTNKTYKITLNGTDSAISPQQDRSGSPLQTAVFTGAENEIWKFVPVEGQDGFYQIVNQKSGYAMDVNGESRVPGAGILQYNVGSGENQKFMLVAQPNGSYKIYSKNSMLPFEASAGEVKQAAERDSSAQEWAITEAVATAQSDEVVYKTLCVKGTSNVLTYSVDQNALGYSALTGADDQQWTLVPETNGNYAVNTKNGGRSMDVANNSTTAGDPIITYTSSTDDNQRWVFEKQDEGGYKIKSVSSGLYLDVDSDGAVQTENGAVFEIGNAE